MKNEKDMPVHRMIFVIFLHHSAGIGRTGCFIATSIGMKQLQEEHMVDILGIVLSDAYGQVSK